MTRAERSLRTALAATAAFSVAYLLPGPLQLPVLLFDPVNRTARFGVNPAGMIMRYYGDLSIACLVGLAAALVAWRFPGKSPLHVATGIALSLIALDVAYYLSRLLAAV